MGRAPGWAQPPRAPAACLTAHPEAQKLRRAQHLLEARERLVACAAPACPEAIRRDCAAWLEEVEALLPSVVVEVQDDQGQSIAGARVIVDRTEQGGGGELLRLDPGPHQIEAAADHGRRSVEVTLRPGERGRVIRLVLPRTRPELAVTGATHGGARWRGWVALSAAAVSAALFGYLGHTADERERALRAGCAPTCDPDEVSRLRWRYRFADAALVGSFVSLGAAVYLLWPAGAKRPASASGVRIGIGSVAWSGTF